MSDVLTVNASGLSCPQPVMMTKKALSEVESGRVEVLVDTATSRNNVSRYAGNKGWKVDVEEREEGGYRLILTK
ncbi:MAG: sulfurtransferase TusA family protein [Synergistaceae bacterium]|nr:sulfurtransferase TusA family protein [Synergistaceae bacterium]MBR1657533.1 sulfurtransferase TusA family protein [Synergistaceae bacterium]